MYKRQIYKQLLQREENDNPIRVGVIGAGQMGTGMIAQIATIPGMCVTGISDINLTAAQQAAKDYKASANKKNDILVSKNFKEVIQAKEVEIIVDATGVPEVGAKIALETLLAKKHLVLLNVEIDITIGPLMHKLFSACLLYTSPSPRDRQKFSRWER